MKLYEQLSKNEKRDYGFVKLHPELVDILSKNVLNLNHFPVYYRNFDLNIIILTEQTLKRF